MKPQNEMEKETQKSTSYVRHGCMHQGMCGVDTCPNDVTSHDACNGDMSHDTNNLNAWATKFCHLAI